jgi:Tol biopolymer transport system component
MQCIALTCLFVLLTLAGTTPVSAQSGNDFFQQALRKERVEGDLKAAIALYQRILKEHAADRALSAKTLVQLGQAYEKMGNADARSSYQRVIREYADQSAQAAVARARLSALLAGATLAAGTEPAVRRVWSGAEVDAMGSPTRDGRLLTFVDWTFGNLALRDLATGEKRLLTNKANWANLSYALYSTPSPDGRRVAYAWSVDARPATDRAEFELRLVGIDGGEPRVLYANPDVEYLHPSEWSPDGKQIVTMLTRRDHMSQIALISATDGAVRVLKTLDWRGPGKMSFSSDGRFLVYDFPPREDSPQRDIYVVATDGSAENVLVRHTANDIVMGWAPDGKHVLFASDRTGNMSVWLVPVANGKPAGEPLLVRRDAEFASVNPLGFTQNGAFLYAASLSAIDMYVASIDPVSGKSAGDPTRMVDHLVGANRAADWTRDGTAVVYVSERQGGAFRNPGSLIIRSLATGAERMVPAQLGSLTSPRWSPDGRFIVGNGRDKNGRPGIFRVDPQSGEATMLVDGPSRQFAGWSADAGSIIYWIQDLPHQRLAVVAQRIDNGDSKDLFLMSWKRSANLYQADVSPDGRQVAFVVIADSGAHTTLRVMSTEGGESRQLFEAPRSDDPIGSLAWSADSRYVFFGLRNGEKARVMRIAAAGGPAQETGVTMDGSIRYLRAHPDGQRIGFTAGNSANEIWVMENFLPRPQPQRPDKPR